MAIFNLKGTKQMLQAISEAGRATALRNVTADRQWTENDIARAKQILVSLQKYHTQEALLSNRLFVAVASPTADSMRTATNSKGRNAVRRFPKVRMPQFSTNRPKAPDAENGSPQEGDMYNAVPREDGRI